MNEQFWGEMLGVLKDIGSYMEKQDATQERAKIDVPPKISENPKPIKGGEMPAGFAPADKIAKNYVPFDEGIDRDAEELEGDEETFLKEGEVAAAPAAPVANTQKGLKISSPRADLSLSDDEDEEYEDEDEEFEEEDEEEEEIEDDEEEIEDDKEEIDELKSLLKDIRSALIKQSKTNSVNTVKAQLKKSLPTIVKGETDKMLRKMGFIPTRGDIKPLDVEKSYGLDETEEVVEVKDIKKSTDKESVMQDALDNMSKKSWTELGQLREKTDGFNAFGSK